MKKSILFSLLMGIVFYVSCTTENVQLDQTAQQNGVLKQSKIVELSKLWIINNSDSLAIMKSVQKIDWDNAVISDTDKVETLEVPLILENNIKVSYLETKNEVVNKLLFIREASGKLKAYHMMIATKDKISPTDPSLSFSNLNSTFDGYVTFVNSSNKTVDLLPSVHQSKPDLTGREIESCTYLIEVYDDGSFRYVGLLYCRYGSGGEQTQNNHGGGGGTGPGKPNPCDKLKTQNNNAAFKAKILELANKTKLKNESGYAQRADGSFQQLTNAGRDQLNLATDAATIGFIHTHLDPYESRSYDPDGNPEIRSPIKMFSPADVKSFISLLINANRNNIPLSDVYGTMVAGNGVYQLRFEGIYSDINTGLNFDGLNEKYKDYFGNISNPEKAFTLFLKEQIKINGISLYKLKSDGTSEKKSLDSNNKLTTTPCQ